MYVSRSLLCLCVLFIAGSIAAQQSACTLPEPQYKVNKPNIFSEQQEQWLGEVQADQQDSEYYLLPDKDSAELARIGQKFLRSCRRRRFTSRFACTCQTRRMRF